MMNKKFNIKKNIGNLIFIVFLFPAYFFSTIFVNHFQQYEYIFSDVNNIKKYQIVSGNMNVYTYINLEDNLYIEGQSSEFEIRKVYEDKNYFIGYSFEENDKRSRIGERYYIVVDKNKAIMKIYDEKDFKEKYEDIEDKKFIDIYNFLKRKGTKIGIYGKEYQWNFKQPKLVKLLEFQ